MNETNCPDCGGNGKQTTCPSERCNMCGGKGQAPKSYELRTINDIFEKVPMDRIPVLLDEMKALAFQRAAFKAMAASIGIQGDYLEPLIWVDDGNATITARIVAHPEGKA